MRFIFNNTALAVGCGCRPRSKIPFCFTHRHAKAWAISERCVYATELLTKREEKLFDAETFWQFLKLLHQASSRSARRIVVISDNAKYHHALLHQQWRQQHQPQFVLHFLPPYSPQLNPIERIWKLTRRLCLHNVFFSHLQELTDGVEQQFNQWRKPNETLRKLCTLT